jgi:hypothetical protein
LCSYSTSITFKITSISFPGENEVTLTKSNNMASDTSQEDKRTKTTMKAVDPSNDFTGYEGEAILGTDQEKNMSLKMAFKYYRKAVIWSITICK